LLKSLDETSIKYFLFYEKIKSIPNLNQLAESFSALIDSNKLDKIFSAKINNLNKEVESELEKIFSLSAKNPSLFTLIKSQNQNNINNNNNSTTHLFTIDDQTNKTNPNLTGQQSNNYNNKNLNQKTTHNPIRIYMDGVFDIIHSGHFNAIRQSKKLGDILVVGVNSDADVEKSKGPTLMSCKERAALARACKWVDEVIEETPYTPTIELLDSLNIDFCAHGDDMPVNANGVGCYDEIKGAGRLRVFKRTEGISTTEIIGRLLMCTKESDRQKQQLAEKGNLPITSSALLKDITEAEFDDQFNKGPVISSFLTTGRRLIEFCNNKVPKQGEKVVYIDGAFDILHIGHIEMLKKAKERGDFLYVGIHDDKTVNGYLGKNSPILNLQERVFNLLALKYVDDVVIGAPLKINEDLIRSLRIDVVLCIKSENSSSNIKDEYANGELLRNNKHVIDDPYEVPKKYNIYEEIFYDFDLNNEILVKRILEKREQYVKKYKNKSEKEEVYYKQEKVYLEEI